MRNDLQRKQRDEIIRRENALFDLELQNQRAKQRARIMGQHARSIIDQIAKTGKDPTLSSNSSGNGNHNKHSSRWFIVILVVLITVGLVLILSGKPETQEKGPVNVTQYQADENTQANNQVTQQSNGHKAVFTDGCIFPDSSNRSLTREEIDAIEEAEGYTRLELIQFAINELYARHHASFKTEKVRQYYNSCSWYVDGGIDPETVKFEPIEENNLKLLTDARSEERKKYSN